MIIYTNDGNPLGLQLLMLAKFAKQPVQVQLVNLNGEFCHGFPSNSGECSENDSFLMQ